MPPPLANPYLDLTAAFKRGRLRAELARERPLLHEVGSGLAKLEAAIDRERRDLMLRNEERLAAYERAAAAWAEQWPARGEEFRSLDLRAGHQLMVEHALRHLPFGPASDRTP